MLELDCIESGTLIAEALSQKAQAQGVSIEVLVNTLLIEHVRESTLSH